MQIICPHCTTSYAVDPAQFGPGGRTVRCARCHETWLARADEIAFASPMAHRTSIGGTQSGDIGTSWDRSQSRDQWGADDTPSDNSQAFDTPHIDSPSIADDWGVSEDERLGGGIASNDGWADEPASAKSRNWLGKLGRLTSNWRAAPSLSRIPNSIRATAPSRLTDKITLTRACVVMGALVFALVVWRAEVVRLLPQTAAFFRMTGLGVNLRGLMFEDVKIANETVGGKPVLVIEGTISSVSRKPVELPRLRFSVIDGQGTDIYAWNSILEQPVLNPGEKVRFKSRLASPPADGREIAVRFFQRRDIVAGGA